MRKEGEEWNVKVRDVELNFKIKDGRVYYKHGNDDWTLSPVYQEEARPISPSIHYSSNGMTEGYTKGSMEDKQRKPTLLKPRLDDTPLPNKAWEGVKSVFKSVFNIFKIKVNRDMVILSIIGIVILGLLITFGYIFVQGI